MARRWIVHIFRKGHHGYLFVDTRSEGRQLIRALQAEGYSGHVTRTGIS